MCRQTCQYTTSLPTIDDMTVNKIDLASPDPGGVAAFYGNLFGWEFSGGTATLGGRRVAGIGPVTANRSTGWLMSVSVAHAEEAGKAIVAAGGVELDPGVFTDNVGARLAVWEGLDQPGDDPGTSTWREIITDDPDATIAFYRTVFGWIAGPPEAPLHRRVLSADGRPVAGLLPKAPHMPADLQPYWDVYFRVADADAAAAAVPRLGGQIVLPPTDIELGRLSVFLDPAGAIFSVIAPKEH
jgi:predicted enzyme related to lactoylglutathione lyase